jgi:hypothetical protein
MDNQMPAQQEETMITLEGDDGNTYSCQLIDIFEFEKQEYALLLKELSNGEKKPAATDQENKEEEEGAIVVMRLIQRDDQYIFQTIENDQEFERVISYVEELAAQSLNEAAESSEDSSS